MRAGALRERLSILKRSPTADGQGGRSVAWVDLITGSATFLTRLSAEVVPLAAGPERLEAAQVTALSTYTVTLRYRADITVLMRVLWTPFKSTTAHTLQISSVNAYAGGRAYLVLECSQVQVLA